MTNKRLLLAAAFSAMIVGAQVHAAPDAGNAGKSQAGGKPAKEQKAKAAERPESQSPDQARRDPSGKGEVTSAEMQARKDERKEVQEQYRSTGEKDGQAGKKPWWKFWEDES